MREDAGGIRRSPAAGAIAFFYLLIAVAIRTVAVLRCRYNTDEPQHLHVAWEWTRGLIPYRDFFDNHLPVFHMLVAPWMAAIGETPHILFYARLLMIPLVLIVLALTWMLAAQLYDSRVAWWATLATAIAPPLLRPTVEFRNDTLWLALLLVTMILLLRGRWFIAGIVLGLALMVSIKTVVFAAAIALAFVVTRYGSLVPLIAGSAVVPTIVVAWFGLHGAADELFRWSVFANGTMPVDAGRRIAGVLSCLGVGTVAIGLALQSSRSKQVFTGLVAALYIALFVAISPLIGPRDFLPTYPVAWIFVFAVLGPWTRHLVIALIVLIAIGQTRLWEPQLPLYPNVIADALRYTSPDEVVFDQKGEMVFRRRASYIALESVSRRLIEVGLMRDTIAVDIVANRAYVAVRDSSWIPPATRSFLNRYFVPVSAIRVAGQRIRKEGTFEIAVPGPYTVVRNGAVLVPSRWYEPGTHRGPAGAVALWSGAVQRGAAARIKLFAESP